jgi:uncharacterized protein YbjT (DUF2867 family)
MHVIAGATGRVGGATARALLREGAEVRVLVRRAVDAHAWRSRGADVRVVDLVDREALGLALRGCAGFFVLLPFDLSVDDLDAHADALIASIAGAVADEHVPHVVALSSGGADLPAGTGPIAGLHRLERALGSTDAIITALRPGHFQEKVAEVIDTARSTGVFPVLAASADAPVPMVAAADVGAIACRSLLDPPAVSEAVDVVGPSCSERDVAALLGAALGRDLHVEVIEEAAWFTTLTQAGLPPHAAGSLVELHRADAQGLLAPRGDRRVHSSTGIASTIRQLLVD